MSKLLNSAVVIAPYSPIGRGEMVHLGAARKIEFVLEMLSRIARRVTLINSAHNGTGWRRGRTSSLRLSADFSVEEYRLFEMPVRPLGKMLNIVFTGGALRYLRAQQPELLWLYNGHALECRLALQLLRHRKAGLAIEIEDAHSARSRGISPKPLIDQIYLDRAVRKADLMTFINREVQGQFSGLGCAKLLFPGSVADELKDSIKRAPFSGSAPLVLGYFGGLEVEKGAHLILEAVPQLASDWKFVVCGRGSLHAEFERMRNAYPDRLELHQNLPARELYELMDRADVVLNPHSDIESMGNGIFPFKVLEGVASGRLILSTPLPPCDLDLEGAIAHFDGTAASLLAALGLLREKWETGHRQVGAARQAVIEAYSIDGFADKVSQALTHATRSGAGASRLPASPA